MRIRILLLSFILTPSLLCGQIQTRILDYPGSVYSFQRVFVTYEVSNEGSLPEVVPLGWCANSGAFVEARPLGGTEWQPISTAAELIPCKVTLVSLLPGERWLLRAFTSPSVWIEGTYELRAVTRSRGTCKAAPGLAEELGTQPIPPIVRYSGQGEYFVQRQTYKCWKGEAYSAPVQVRVEVPQGEQDQAVREWLGDPPQELNRYRKELAERFPRSQYTYAAHIWTANVLSLQRAMELQPSNPLSQDVLGYLAYQIIKRSGPCVDESRMEPLSTPTDELAVSEPVKVFLKQEKQRLIDECPRIQEQRRLFEEYKQRKRAEGYEMPD